MRNLIVLLFFLSFSVNAQEKDSTKVEELKADIKLYKTFNLEKDTIYIDTSLTIQDEYKYNYLKKIILDCSRFQMKVIFSIN